LTTVRLINSLFFDAIPENFIDLENLFFIIDNKNDSLIDYKKLNIRIDELLKKDVKSYQLWFCKGLLAEKLQNYNTALEAYTHVLELKPDFVFAWLNRANASFEMLNFINSIGETIEIGVDNQSKSVVANSDFVQDYSQILNDYSKVIEKNPDLPFAYYNRANLKVKSKNYDASIFDYERAIKLEPDFADAYYNLALVLIYQENFEKACQILSKAGELGLQKAYLVIKKYCSN
jgi:tetratricopeptide (TPR) repeat protein